jgi:D-glycero-D-manno-heptose 1,7-bisphosphate phosphatase
LSRTASVEIRIQERGECRLIVTKILDPGIGVNSLVIFDRDGTLSEDHGPMSGKSHCIILPNVLHELKRILNPKISFAIATNQSYVGRGNLRLQDVEEFNSKLLGMLSAIGLEMNYIAICPHTPDDNCLCRKPKPGMINELVAISGIMNKSKIFFIGDKDSDEQAAIEAGITPLNLQKMDFGSAISYIDAQLKQGMI